MNNIYQHTYVKTNKNLKLNDAFNFSTYYMNKFLTIDRHLNEKSIQLKYLKTYRLIL